MFSKPLKIGLHFLSYFVSLIRPIRPYLTSFFLLWPPFYNHFVKFCLMSIMVLYINIDSIQS